MKKILFEVTNTGNRDELFNYITSTFKNRITTWEYYVNWQKVIDKVNRFEKELNILNYLVGKEDIKKETYDLIKEYPHIISAFPVLLAIRENSIDILVDVENFIYKHYDFRRMVLSDDEVNNLTDFIINSGLGSLIKNRKIKNLVDYVTGVEVGLDTNGRKNRGGNLMEEIVETHVDRVCSKHNLQYLAQANSRKIENNWGIKVPADKTSRIIDFVIKKKK